MKFENANVLITGGASGIGRIMGRMALEKGAACLIIWDINPQNIASAVNELSHIGKVKGYVVDVSRNDLVTEGYAKVMNECGEIDILINCAGIVTSNKTFDRQTADEIVRTMESYYMVPLKDSSYEMEAKFETIRRNDYTYTEYEDLITEAEKHSKVDARDQRMSALWDYIGNGATGLYPRFNENAERAEQAIQRYIAELREVR